MIKREELKAYIINTLAANERAYGELNCLGDEEYPEVADTIINHINTVLNLKDIVRSLTDEQRVELFSGYCKSCGCNNPNCQCENDD
jgi:hypothetical protein